jgi:hypothetical protein
MDLQHRNYKRLTNHTLQYHCTTAHIKSSNHTLSLHRLTSCTLLYSSSLPLYSCRLLLTPPAHSLLRNSAHLCRRTTDMYHRKHMSHDGYPASPLARWLLPTENTCHVTATYCCGDVIAPARKFV